MTKMTRIKGPLGLALGLTAAAVLASCSQTNSPAAAGATRTTATTTATTRATAGHAATGHPTTSSPGSPSTSAGRRVDITVKGKQVTPRPRSVRIKVGESLTVAVTSDHSDTLHAHGFEIAKSIKAGQRLEFTVKGAKPGIYEVELHDPALRILQIAVG